VRLASDSPKNALRLGYNTVFADATPVSLALFNPHFAVAASQTRTKA